MVFPYVVGERMFALRCWHTEVPDIRHRMELITGALGASGLRYFVPLAYVPEAIMTSNGIQPAIIMKWTDAMPLKRYIEKNLDRPKVLDALADSFLTMVKDLHRLGFSHGDLQHGNILVHNDGSLVLTDYDSMYVPGLEKCTDSIKGLPGFQHPARAEQLFLSNKSDYFSELVIYTSIRALARHPGLWKKLDMADSETMILSAADIESRGTSDIFCFLETDRILRPLNHALIDSLNQKSIDSLMPLEYYLEGPASTLTGGIASKWKTIAIPVYSSLAASIASRW